jgi:hypothetical protein
MTDYEADPIVQRAVEELRQLPPLDQAAVRRIAGAAAAARLTPAADDLVVSPRPRIRWSVTIGLAAAAAIVGFIARDLVPSDRPAGPQVERAPATVVAPTPVRPAVSSGSDVALVPQPFVLENATARRVSVVGDFNNWNPNVTPMARSTDGSLWSVIVPITPGRHLYGFMVNDSIFTLDPRGPRVRDPDFGTDASVLMVTRP